MGKITPITGADFSLRRQGIPAVPVNNVPPVAEGIHPYMPRKFDNTAEVITDPWGDASTDFKKVIDYGKPVYNAVGSAAMGLKPVLTWATTPTPRIVLRQTVAYPIKKWCVHIAYTVNGIIGGSGNRCAWSFVNTDRSKVLLFYGTTTSEGPPRISHGAGAPGSINPLGSNDITLTPRNITFSSPVLAANQKEILSFVYDGTATGGTITVYRNGNATPIATFTAVGELTLEGDFYLGTDVRSNSNSSDFKGEIGYFIIDELTRTTDEITAIYNFMNKALQ